MKTMSVEQLFSGQSYRLLPWSALVQLALTMCRSTAIYSEIVSVCICRTEMPLRRYLCLQSRNDMYPAVSDIHEDEAKTPLQQSAVAVTDQLYGAASLVALPTPTSIEAAILVRLLRRSTSAVFIATDGEYLYHRNLTMSSRVFPMSSLHGWNVLWLCYQHVY